MFRKKIVSDAKVDPLSPLSEVYNTEEIKIEVITLATGNPIFLPIFIINCDDSKLNVSPKRAYLTGNSFFAGYLKNNNKNTLQRSMPWFDDARRLPMKTDEDTRFHIYATQQLIKAYEYLGDDNAKKISQLNQDLLELSKKRSAAILDEKQLETIKQRLDIINHSYKYIGIIKTRKNLEASFLNEIILKHHLRPKQPLNTCIQEVIDTIASTHSEEFKKAFELDHGAKTKKILGDDITAFIKEKIDHINEATVESPARKPQ